MTSVQWVLNNDDPRELTNDEIEDIISGLYFSKCHTPVHENLINIHKTKTQKKLKTIKIKPSKISELKKGILDQFYKSVIAPGEAVGVNAAQCIGEPTTQLTLNSVARDEELLIIENDEIKIVKIGDWIDNHLETSTDRIQFIPENRTEYLELNHKVLIQSPNENGAVNWDVVTAVTKHLPVGDLVKITTISGRQVKVTQNKSLLVWDGNELIEKNGSDVTIGDCVPVIGDYKLSDEFGAFEFGAFEFGAFELGELFGIYLSNDEDSFEINGENDRILEMIEKNCKKLGFDYKYFFYGDRRAIVVKDESFIKGVVSGQYLQYALKPCNNLEFVRGILNGITTYTGYPLYTSEENKQYGINFITKSKDLFNYIVILCRKLNVYGSTIFEEGTYMYQIFNLETSFFSVKVSEYNTNYYKHEDIILEPIISVEQVKYDGFVYDLTVPNTKNFSLVNGLGIRDTFHSTGISAKNVTLGFPRARELFNATRSQSNPSCTIYFLRDNDSPDKLHKYTDHLPESNIDNLLKGNGWDIYDPEQFTQTYWHKAWFKIYGKGFELTPEHWILRLQFDIGKLYEHNLTIKDVAKKLESTYNDIKCIPSPLNIGIIDIAVNCAEINLSNARSGELSDITDDYTAKGFYMNHIVSPKIRGTQACGIVGISKIYYRYADCDETFGGYPLKPEIKERLTSKKEWIAETDGTNLPEVISQKGVDPYRTMSNDMWEIFGLLGIEAARKYLFLEFMNIAKNGGISINTVHFEILVSKMTYTGAIRAITRFGVETLQYGPIARATFEEVMSQLVTSAMFSEVDNLNGISSNIVLGTKINAGTGVVQLDSIPLKVIGKEQH